MKCPYWIPITHFSAFNLDVHVSDVDVIGGGLQYRNLSVQVREAHEGTQDRLSFYPWSLGKKIVRVKVLPHTKEDKIIACFDGCCSVQNTFDIEKYD